MIISGFASDWNTFFDAVFKTTGGVIHGWQISRQSTPSSWGARRLADRSHRIVMRGVYGLQGLRRIGKKRFKRLLKILSLRLQRTGNCPERHMTRRRFQWTWLSRECSGTCFCHAAELSIDVYEEMTYAS